MCPRGVPKAGFRNRKAISTAISRGVGRQDLSIDLMNISHETDEQIREKLQARFSVIEMLTEGTFKNACRALIISGPAGLGKSYTVEQTLRDADPDEKKHIIVKGFARATFLYRTMYEYRHAGNTIVLDDADALFFDPDALNLLKAAMDTNDRRRIFWGAETRMTANDGSLLPTSFDFEGSIVLITNFDFDRGIESGNKLSAHFEALISRSHYVDCEMHSVRDYLIRIAMVCEEGMLRDMGLNEDDEKVVLDFLFKNSSKLRELTLRMCGKLAGIYMSNRDQFERIAKITCFKRV